MIMGGTALAVFTLGISQGTYDMMTDLACRSATGHLQAQHPEYLKHPSLFKSLKAPQEIRTTLEMQTEVKGNAFRVEAGVFFSYQEPSKDEQSEGLPPSHTAAGMLLGVEPEREAQVTHIPNSVKEGHWLKAPREIVLDRSLAQRLKAPLGAEITLITQGADGSMAYDNFKLSGLSDSGIPAAVAYLSLKDAQDLLVLGSRVHQVLMVVDELSALPKLKALKLPEGVLRSWDEILPGLASSIASDRAGGSIFLVIVLLVVLLGVANTMMMVVFERTREFGVMLALGTTPRQILALTLSEAAWLSFIATSLGSLLGSLTNVWLSGEGIPLGEYTMEFGGVVIDRMLAQNSLLISLMVPGLIFVAGVLAAFFPALRASRLSPSQALRAS